MQRVRDLGPLRPKQDIFIKSFPSRLSEPWVRGGIRSVRAQGNGGHHENKALYVTIMMHIRVHRTQGLHRCASAGNLELKGEVDRFLPLTQKQSPVDGQLQMKIQFPLRELP